MASNNKENQSCCGNTNLGNKRTFHYKTKSNGAGKSTNTPRFNMEIKLHMHDAKQKKTIVMERDFETSDILWESFRIMVYFIF